MLQCGMSCIRLLLVLRIASSANASTFSGSWESEDAVSGFGSGLVGLIGFRGLGFRVLGFGSGLIGLRVEGSSHCGPELRGGGLGCVV